MTATGSHLFGGRINLMLVRESARIELKDILGNPTQKKVSLLHVCVITSRRGCNRIIFCHYMHVLVLAYIPTCIGAF